MRRRCLTLLCAITASACTSASTPPSTIPGRELSGRIAFDRNFDIWTMDADGGDPVRLTDHPGEDFDPAWSSDGAMIAFRSHRDGNEEVYVMRADGSGLRNLTSSPTSDYSPSWSPDGTRIAFATDRDADSGGNDIYTVEPDGTGLMRLTSGGGIDEYPSWSPDGSKIAFACSGGRRLPEGVADFEICVMNSDGSDPVQLTDAPGLSDHPAWSPDGSVIAFMTTRDGWPTLPDYTPPGYEEGEFGEYEIYMMNADGTDPRSVTRNGREDEQFPTWSPDGRYLMFSRYGCLVVSTPDGSWQMQVTRECADGFPSWSG